MSAVRLICAGEEGEDIGKGCGAGGVDEVVGWVACFYGERAAGRKLGRLVLREYVGGRGSVIERFVHAGVADTQLPG